MANLHNFCNAIIIGKQFALTTGTCCTQPLNRILYMGGDGTRDDKSQTERLIVDFRIYPDFDADTISDDVCVIKMESEIQYSDKIMPICINDNKR